MTCFYKGYEINKEWAKVYWKKQNKKLVCKQYIALDTETSHNHNEDAPECWIYQWAFAFNKGLYFGRKPSELITKLKELIEFYNIDDKHKLIIFIHNLPYDFSYLCLFLQSAFGDPVNVLASEPHKPFIVGYSNGLEFRCSYKLSNDSLERWGHKLGIAHPKMSGAIDYDVIRYQQSKLNRDDWRYMFTDCIALDECINKQMIMYDDNIITMPFTSTGYPRRTIFREYNGTGKHDKKNKERVKFKDTALDKDSYIACNEEFSGGITHGNRHYKGKILQGDIRHRDFVSHYPTQQHKLFPMEKLAHFTNDTTLDALAPYADEYFILCHVKLTNVRVRSKKITLPYLQTSHVMRYHSQGIRVLDDNGRIIQFKGSTYMWLEYRELKLITEQYSIQYMDITKTYRSKLGNLPGWMVNTIDKHFKGKSDKKDALKEAEKSEEIKEIILQMSLDLLKDKNLLNGIFGVSATNPVRQEIELKGDIWEIKPVNEDTITEKLEGYYKSYKHCMRYQWGIQTTLLARLQLMEIYKIIGPDNYIYADTDSMFYFSTPDIEAALDEYNAKCKQWAMDTGAYITTDKGQIITYNAFLDEGEKITEFTFLHSKCYAYTTDDGKLHCTIAGVKAYDRETKTFREDELKSIDELADRKIFTKCGGTTAKYISTTDIIKTAEDQESGGGCIIGKTTKTLTNIEWSETEKAYQVMIEN